MIADIAAKTAKNFKQIEDILSKGKMQESFQKIQKAQMEINALTSTYTGLINSAKTQATKLKLAEGFNTKVTELKELISEQKEYIENNDVILRTQKRISEFFQRNIKLMIAGIGTFAAFMVKSFDDLRANMVKTFGVSTPRIQGMLNLSREMFLEYVAFGASVEDITEIIGLASKKLGTLDLKRLDNLTKSALDLSIKLGLGTEASIDLSIALEKVGKSAEKFFQEAELIAREFGVGTGIIVSNIADMAGELTGFDINKLSRASGFAAKLGLTLKEAASAMEKFSDLSSGIESTLKINLLTSSKLNAQTLFMANIMGDVEGATQHIAENLAASNFEMLPRGFKKQIAESLGFTIDQLSVIIKSVRTGTGEFEKLLESQTKLNTLNDVGIQKMSALNILWARLKVITLSAVEPLAIALGKIIDKLITFENGIAKVSTSFKVGFYIALGAAGTLGAYLLILKIQSIKAFFMMSAAVKEFAGSIVGATVATRGLGIGISTIGKSSFLSGLLTPHVIIGIFAVSAAFLALGAAVLMTGKGFSLMKDFGTENVQIMAQMIPILLGIGAAAIFAAQGLGAFSVAAIPAAIAATALNVVGITPERKEIINYDKIKESFKAALNETELKIEWNGKIESTPIFVSDKKFAEITHKAIRTVT